MTGKPFSGLLPAAVLTLLMFLVVPFLERVSVRTAEADIQMVEVHSVPPPVIPPPERHPVPRRSESPETQRPFRPPAPVTPRSLPPIRPVLNLDGLSPEIKMDLGVSFVMSPPRLTGEGMGLFALNDLDEEPYPIRQIRPTYPESARYKQTDGSVDLVFVVGEDGNVRDIRVVSASDGFFRTAALRAVRRWRYRPGKRDGAPVAVRIRQTIRFQMER